jgi:hypothetical protein
MAQVVCNSAQLLCSFGTVPGSLVVTPEKRVNVAGQPAANIQDFAPFKNIQPFGMCTTVSNPQVAASPSLEHRSSRSCQVILEMAWRHPNATSGAVLKWFSSYDMLRAGKAR